ncbi:MAG: cytochrome c [Chloroflexi bacterium]|nr:cytochrome c [Chloroflexota bacterium]
MSRIALVLALIVVLLAACNQKALTNPVTGDPARGAEIFHQGVNGAPACAGCHTTSRASFTRGGISIAPNLSGLSQRAGSRIEGLSAEQYLFNSITSPGSFVVDGFQNLMYGQYANQLSRQDLADLLAYLMTL